MTDKIGPPDSVIGGGSDVHIEWLIDHSEPDRLLVVGLRAVAVAWWPLLRASSRWQRGANVCDGFVTAEAGAPGPADTVGTRCSPDTRPASAVNTEGRIVPQGCMGAP